MADSNVDITAGSGTSIDTRTEDTNSHHRQVVVLGDPTSNDGVAPVDGTAGVKVNLGADNDVTVSGTVTANLSATDNAVLDAIQAAVETIDDAISGTEMQVDIVSSALPSGAATAANQTTIIGHVDGIEALLTTIDADTSSMNTDLSTIAGAVSGSEMQVDIVSGSVTANIEGDYVDDAAYTVASDRGLAVGGVFTTDTVDSGDFGAFAMDASRRQLISLEVDNVGLATAANQSTANTALSAIQTAVEIIDNAISGSEMQVDVLTMPTVTVSATQLDIDSLTKDDDEVLVWANTVKDGTGTDYVPLVDTDGHLQVDVLSGGGGGTQYAEDSAHNSGDTGTMALAVRNDDPAALAGTDGDYAPLQVSDDGRLYVSTKSIEDSNNSTTTPLGISGVFTGTSTETLNYKTITIVIFADENSATDGVSLQWSPDGTNWDHTATYTYTANGDMSLGASVRARYFRLVYTNGTTAQTAFRCYTFMHPTEASHNIRPLEYNLTGQESAEVTRAVLSAYNGTTYTNIDATAGGNLKVSLQEISDGLDIGAGNAGSETQRVSISTDDVNLSAIKTATELIDDAVYTDDTSTHATGTSKGVGLMAVATPTDSTVDSNDYGTLAMTTTRRLRTSTTIDAAIPAGDNNIGNVDIASSVALDVSAATVTVDSELPAAAALADATANPTTTTVGSFPHLWDGLNSDWNRQQEIRHGLNNSGQGVAASGVMIEYDDTTPSPVTENQFGPLRGSSRREAYTQIRDAAGNERGVNVDASNQLLVVDANTATIAGAVSGSEMQVDVVSALPAGTNAIGKLAANSGVDIGDVDVTSITGLTMSNGAAQVTGDEAHDAADAGNPVKIGGKASTSEPTAVANSDRVNAYFDAKGYQRVKADHPITGIGHGVTTVTTAGTDVVLASSTTCKKVAIQAQTDNTGLIAVGGSGVDATEATGSGILLSAGDTFVVQIDDLNDIYIDSTVNGEGVRYTYFT